MYEAQTEQAIRDRMLAAVNSLLDKREGSFTWDAIAPVALELAELYIQLEHLHRVSFVTASYGGYLDLRAQEWGLTRHPATQATGVITLTGTAGVVVPAGTRFRTGGGVEFELTADAGIDAGGVGTGGIRAVMAGVASNVMAGTITEIPTAIQGLQSVTNAEPTSGGAEVETDDMLRERLLERMSRPATSGNIYHYIQWAKAVPGIGDARVVPIWDGPGTVKVVLLDANRQPASAELVAEVVSYIEAERPIGALVTVVAATGVPINVSVTISYDAGLYTLEEITTDVEQAITAHLAQVAFRQGYVSYAKLGAVLMGIDGLTDYSGLLVNGGTANIVLADDEVPILGEVILNAS